MKNRILSVALLALLSCHSKGDAGHNEPASNQVVQSPSGDTSRATQKVFSAKEILAHKQVPILCYHRLRAWKPTDTRSMKDYIVPVERFREQIKMLADSGYHTILPDQLYAYLTKGTPLPSKPIMLTFDDSEEEHYTIANTEMKKYGFRGVFFIMTVTFNRPGYLTKDQIKALSDDGNVIACHTWDHHNVKKYQGADWQTQIEKPLKQLTAITGKPVKYFAYPFGLWNEAAIPELKKYGFIAAFQLGDKRSEMDPLFTIRRMIVPGEWTTAQLSRRMHGGF